MVGVAAVYLVPVEGALSTLDAAVDSVGGELVVVELILNGVGRVLREGVEAIGGVLHVLMGIGAIEAPGAAVVLPDEVIPAVGVDASVAGELVVEGLAFVHG